MATNPAFSGYWDDRIAGIFESGVVLEGKRVLDVGCNMGLVAYEVSKKQPALIHGCDYDKPSIATAKMLFKAVNAPSRFEVVDLVDQTAASTFISERYDVVFFLAVYHKLIKADEMQADRLARRLLRSCETTLLFRGGEPSRGLIEAFAKAEGFELVWADPVERPNVTQLVRFDRVR